MSDAETLATGDQSLKRRITAGVLLLSFGAVVVAERDLRSRPAEQIRGPKSLWRIGSANAVIALAYLRWGRRSAEIA